ncbi:MAG: hypothetical protein U0835_15990 [Isosphaeraceae bacterium]
MVADCDARDGSCANRSPPASRSASRGPGPAREAAETGSIAPRPRGGRAPAFGGPAAARLREAVRADGDATLAELACAAGVSCSPSAVHRTLDRLGGHAQKKSRRAAEQDRPGLKAERAAWCEEFAAVDLDRLVFIDESGASTAVERTHGRAPSGVRVDGPVPHGHWKVTTLTAAVRLGGVPEAACLAFDGTTDSACFEAYVGGTWRRPCGRATSW